jgi:hypothetical protein
MNGYVVIKYLTQPTAGSIAEDAFYKEHRLNMELVLQSLFGLHVTWCAHLYLLAETPQLQHPPSPRIGLVYGGRCWSAKIDDIFL